MILKSSRGILPEPNLTCTLLGHYDGQFQLHINIKQQHGYGILFKYKILDPQTAPNPNNTCEMHKYILNTNTGQDTFYTFTVTCNTNDCKLTLTKH